MLCLSTTLNFGNAGYRDRVPFGLCSFRQEIFLVGGVWYGMVVLES